MVGSGLVDYLSANSKQLPLLKRSFALISPQWDELVTRSCARFIVISSEMISPSSGVLQQATEQILVALRDGSQPQNARVKKLAEPALRPRQLAILAIAILTSAGEILDDEWTVEVESVWDAALHHLISQLIHTQTISQR